MLRDPEVGAREVFIRELNQAGFEVRPIVSGNFAKNEVLRYFDYTIHSLLANADYVETHGLFIGNHHYDLSKAIDTLK